jgi:hypothetical protein
MILGSHLLGTMTSPLYAWSMYSLPAVSISLPHYYRLDGLISAVGLVPPQCCSNAERASHPAISSACSTKDCNHLTVGFRTKDPVSRRPGTLWPRFMGENRLVLLQRRPLSSNYWPITLPSARTGWDQHYLLSTR